MNIALSPDRVMEVFCSLAGRENAGAGRLFCETAAYDTERRIRKDCDVAENMKSLCYVAGCLAFYRYVLAGGEGENVSLRAGDVTVRSSMDGRMAEYARTLLCDALESNSDLLRGRRRVFKSF